MCRRFTLLPGADWLTLAQIYFFFWFSFRLTYIDGTPSLREGLKGLGKFKAKMFTYNLRGRPPPGIFVEFNYSVFRVNSSSSLPDPIEKYNRVLICRVICWEKKSYESRELTRCLGLEIVSQNIRLRRSSKLWRMFYI